MIRYYVKIEDLWPTCVGGSPIVTYKRADSEDELRSILKKEFVPPEKQKGDVIIHVLDAELYNED